MSGDSRAELSDGALRHAALGTGILVLIALVAGGVCRASGADACLPGSPLMQSAAIVGSVLCVSGFLAALAKRRGGDGRLGFRRHVLLTCAGVVPIALHTTASLDHEPALLLVVLLALGALGTWARLRGARMLSGLFGSRAAGFSGAAHELRAQLRQLAERKQRLLDRLEPGADEAVYTLSPAAWRKRPGLALRYRRLMGEENRLLAAARGTPPSIDRWRLVHQLLAAAFVVGLAVHVVLVTFFAGYVAEGRVVYWWHITAWNLGFGAS